MTPHSARERILQTASTLFYREGYRATGIDRIIAESGVAKMSFYRHFPSKSDLILAYLMQRHAEWMHWFTTALQERIDAMGTFQLEMVAEVLGAWFAQEDFRGCAFINAVAETGLSADGAMRETAARHKEDLVAYLDGLLKARGPLDARLARAVVLIIDGLIVRYQTTHNPQEIDAARYLLSTLDTQSPVVTPK
ncbi:MAG: TetR/AcrR family transcriptional regulator [Burkholderiales bacterium]|nr:TetR/AcrR family transcriptional regulator [Burkholderiales bacterium]